VGPSGSGKSTLLNILGARDLPTRGEVRINGVATSTLRQDELATLRNHEEGFVFQAHYLLDEFTCVENVLIPVAIRRVAPSEEQRQRAILLLKRDGLGDQLYKRPDEMSPGQNQRCAIVRAVIHEPKIVLADEPTGNLDGDSGKQIFEVMRAMSRI